MKRENHSHTRKVVWMRWLPVICYATTSISSSKEEEERMWSSRRVQWCESIRRLHHESKLVQESWICQVVKAYPGEHKKKGEMQWREENKRIKKREREKKKEREKNERLLERGQCMRWKEREREREEDEEEARWGEYKTGHSLWSVIKLALIEVRKRKRERERA